MSPYAGLTKDQEQAMRDTGMCPKCWQPIKNFTPRVTQKDVDRYNNKGPDGSRAADIIASFRAIGRDPLTGHATGCERSSLRFIQEKPDYVVMPNKPKFYDGKKSTKSTKSTASRRKVQKPT